jgi:Tfp pilus assembly protein PilX
MRASKAHHHAHAAGRRRGSIYAVVLALAVLVSLIGLSAVAVGRINLRSAANSSDAAEAELLAVSAVEHGVAVLNSQANWRSNTLYFNEQTTNPVALGDGQFRWKL